MLETLSAAGEDETSFSLWFLTSWLFAHRWVNFLQRYGHTDLINPDSLFLFFPAISRSFVIDRVRDLFSISRQMRWLLPTVPDANLLDKLPWFQAENKTAQNTDIVLNVRLGDT